MNWSMRRTKQLAFLFLAIAGLSTGCGGDKDDTGNPIPVDAGGLVNDVSPSKRSDIHGAMDPATGSFAVFGGDDGPIVNQTPMARYRSDTWLFTQGIGWEDVSSAGPSARGRQAVAYDSSSQRMLIFGGRFRPEGMTGNYTLFGDLWSFGFADKAWTQLSDGQGGPQARYFATSAFDSDSGTFYVYGGATSSSALSIRLAEDLWSFKDNVWTQVTTSGSAPSPARLFMAYTHDTKRNALIAFGGQIGDFVSPALNDVYSLDLATGVWSALPATGTAPSGRFSSLMTYDTQGDRYIMMGGHADLGVTNDVWAYSPDAGSWDQLYVGDTFTGGPLGCLGNPREIPKTYMVQDTSGPERRSGGFLGYSDNSVWLFGGESDCSDHLDDTWRLDLSDNSWNEELSATSGESCARQNSDCQCLCL
ncbi:MAG: hypothetical protein JKY56_11085 [Kofleriaceae bacterium]|nr:hypothetical protein [Kofleriaceae bacterium]